MDCPDFLASEFPPRAAGEAFFHVIPAPFEASVSYGCGAAHGPAAILRASQQLEGLVDGRSPGGDPVDGRRGIHTQPPVECSVPAAGATGEHRAVEVMRRIRCSVGAAFAAGAVPALLGGEHTVTCGALMAVRDAWAAAHAVGVVQFDAHADLRDRYDGNPYSHASVMRRAAELGFPLFQVGVRHVCAEEAEWRREHSWQAGREPRVAWLDAREAAGFGQPPLREAVSLELPPDFPRLIYLSFDLDGLDPSIISATGTPVPGGLGWYQALAMIESLSSAGRRIIGFDVVELAPDDRSRASDFAAAQLVYHIMGHIHARARNRPG